MKEVLERHLATILVHIRRDDDAIARQTETIRRLEENHRDACLAKRLLAGFEDLRRADEELRGRLVTEIDRY